MRKPVVYISLLLALIIGYFAWTNAMAPHASLAKSPIDFVLSPEELLLAFEEDEETANKKYLDKVIEVSGKVVKTEESNGKTSIYLDANNPLSNIIFQLEKSEEEIKLGDQIKLKGICTGYLLDVILVRAIKI